MFYVIWNTGTKPKLTPPDSRRQFGLSDIRIYDHQNASPELYHFAAGADNIRSYLEVTDIYVYSRLITNFTA